jgi:hypothetical protein
MVFLQHLQQKLKELYKEFPENLDEINIQLKPNNFTISTVDQVIEVATDNIKRKDFNPYLLDLFNAELDFDFGLYVETDLRKLLKFSEDIKNPNGKRLLAYSLLETRINQLQQRTSKTEMQKQLEKLSQQNIKRLLQISKRTHRLLQEINEFPIRMTEKVTPRWLYNLTNNEFEEFMKKCNRMNNFEQHFAGAQS